MDNQSKIDVSKNIINNLQTVDKLRNTINYRIINQNNSFKFDIDVHRLHYHMYSNIVNDDGKYSELLNTINNILKSIDVSRIAFIKVFYGDSNNASSINTCLMIFNDYTIGSIQWSPYSDCYGNLPINKQISDLIAKILIKFKKYKIDNNRYVYIDVNNFTDVLFKHYVECSKNGYTPFFSSILHYCGYYQRHIFKLPDDFTKIVVENNFIDTTSDIGKIVLYNIDKIIDDSFDYWSM